MSLDPRWISLHAALAEEAEHYTRALCAAEKLPAAIRDGQDAEPHLQELVRQMDVIVHVEQRIAGPKQQWLHAGTPASAELEELRVRLVELIRALLEQVFWAEKEATLRKHQLAPQLDTFIRGQQMQRAYGASFRRGFEDRGGAGA